MNKGLCSCRHWHKYQIRIYSCIISLFIYHKTLKKNKNKNPSLNGQYFMSCFKRGAGKHPIFLLQWIIPMISQKLKICLRSCCCFLVVIWHTVHQSSHASGCVFLVVCLWVELHWHKQYSIYSMFPVAAFEAKLWCSLLTYQLFIIQVTPKYLRCRIFRVMTVLCCVTWDHLNRLAHRGVFP